MSGQVAADRRSVSAPVRRVRRTSGPGGRLTAYLLLVPAALFLAVFFVWPMIQALLLSVRGEHGGWTTANFHRMVGDAYFWPSVRYTLLFIVIIVPCQLVLALVMGMLLQADLRFKGFFLYIWAIPLAISDLASGIVWLSIFSPNGFLNSIVHGLGMQDNPFPFLSIEHPVSRFLAIVIAEMWRATSLVMIILLAGIQVIPKDYAEAAEIFGANAWQRLRYVTLPLLRPSLQVALILRTLAAFQVFAIVLALVGRQVPVLAGEAYNWSAVLFNNYIASAYAVVILIVSILVTVVYLRALRVRDEQQGL
jgi:multiple sugar transport system permease protein